MILLICTLFGSIVGLLAGYVLSKSALTWCPTCGQSLDGHCPVHRRSQTASQIATSIHR